MNKLAEWTNTWFIRPSTCARPSADESLWIFSALVSLLGPEMSEADSRVVHAYFRYLLLECDVEEDVRPWFVRLLDFEHPYDIGARWNLLMYFSRLDRQQVVHTPSSKSSDWLARLTLSLVLISSPKRPTITTFIRRCIDLYQRNLDYSTTTAFSVEYKSNSPMFYLEWIKEVIDDIFRFGQLTDDEIFASISYMAWFANLVRVRRMFKASRDSNQEASGVVDEILKGQVQLLLCALDIKPLSIESAAPSNHLLDLLGIRPKKKVK